MQNKGKELNFSGQNIYVGIDVHLKSWSVTILTGSSFFKTFSQPPEPEVLHGYLTEHFPGANYYSAYEAGFSGLWAHYQLRSMSIQNIVVNPADIPTSQKDQVYKTDSVDSKKIAYSLRANILRGIYIPKQSTLEDRSLIRTRAAIVKNMTRIKLRIKSMLNFYGIKYPKEHLFPQNHWSRKFMKWLKDEIAIQEGIATQAFLLLLEEFEYQRQLLLKTTRAVRELSRTTSYASNIEIIRSVPGIGPITAITFLTEIEDIHRFVNNDKFAGYIGLIPNCHSSGESNIKGEITFRRQINLRKTLHSIDIFLLIFFATNIKINIFAKYINI